MGNPVQKIVRFFSSSRYSRILGVLALLVIIAAVPLTVFIAQQQQEIRQRAAETDKPSSLRSFCINEDCSQVRTYWNAPPVTTYYYFIRLFKEEGGVTTKIGEKWTKGNNLKVTFDVPPQTSYWFRVIAFQTQPTFTCDLESSGCPPNDPTVVAWYNTSVKSEENSAVVTARRPRDGELGMQEPTNPQAVCNSGCTALNLSWGSPGPTVFPSKRFLIRMPGHPTSPLGINPWPTTNSATTSITPNSTYRGWTIQEYQGEPDMTDLEMYYGGIRSWQVGFGDIQAVLTPTATPTTTAQAPPLSCNISASQANGVTTVTYSGTGGTVRSWLQRKDGTAISSANTVISPYTRTYTISSSSNYFELTRCDAGASNCGDSFALTAPVGEYYLHCDVLVVDQDQHRQDANYRCSGNPQCDYKGGSLTCGGVGIGCTNEAGAPLCKWKACATTTSDTAPTTGRDYVPITIGSTVTEPPPPDTSTPPPSGNGQQLAFKLSFPGIGTRAQGAGNLNNPTPRHPQRSITVQVYSADGTTLVQSKTVTTGLAYQASTQTFDGTVTLNSALSAGNYVVKVKSNGYLYRRIPTVLVITSGNNTYNMYQGTTYPILIPGDINNDNIVNLLDYNLFIECYRATATCNADNKTLSDLNDDSLVNSEDLLILTRSFEIRNGD